MSLLQDYLPQVVEPFDADTFRRAMGQFASGVVVVTSELDGEVHGMTVNAFMSGSLEPPLIIVSIACKARSHGRIKAAGGFGVSMLALEQQWVSNHFAGRVAENRAPTFVELAGVPVLADAKAAVATVLHDAFPCGDHTLFVGRVTGIQLPEESKAPLLYHSGKYGKLDAN